MRKTLAEIAKLVDGKIVGDKDLVITGLSGIKEAVPGDLTFLAGTKYLSLAEKTKASAILVEKGVTVPGKTTVDTSSPSLAFANVMSLLMGGQGHLVNGIHETALIGKNVVLGKNVAIGAYAVIEDDVQIGDHTIVYSHVFIGRKSVLGKDGLIYPNVTIRERTQIGNSVIIHSGTVIGSDGYGYVQINGRHQKIPQIGNVIIEDDVEIGANAVIDRARFDKTVIGRGTKIDNLVHVGHNVRIGENCLIVAQVGISGSVTIGNGVTMGGQVGLAGHIHLGDGVQVAAQSAVMKSVPPNVTVLGSPARPYSIMQRVHACMQRLPEYVKTINELKKRVETLEKNPHG